MCGIFGWIPAPQYCQAPAVPVAERLIRALRHRGPNDAGYALFSCDAGRAPCTEADTPPESFRLLLGQTRLSIIDLSAAGHQPMQSRDGRYTLIYNGEVYNYQELRTELTRLGAVFYTQTDSEVVLHALIHWGKAALLRFTGMFALAFFDAHQNTLFLARDFFGIKPLYYYIGTGGLYFASELPALLEFPDIPRRVDAVAAYQFLCYGQYDCGERTFVENIRHIPAGHCCTVSIQEYASMQLEHYWKPDLRARSTLSFADAAQNIRELFLDSVRLHLRSDVPLGVALSGGIDSSATTCAIRHLEPDMPLHTFSFIAKNSPVSEEYWANAVAEYTGAVRHTVEVAPSELVHDLDAMIRALGEPFGSTSIYAQYRVFLLAKTCGITVTLDGQGADELFAGYHGYPGPRMASLLRQGHIAQAVQFFRAAHAWPERTWKFLCIQTTREFVPAWLTPLALRCMGRSVAPSWLHTDMLRQKGVPLLREDSRATRFPSPDKVRQTLAYQLTWNGLPQLLRHGDRNAMAHSIESRVPFLTREMAEFCLRLPEEYLIDMQGCSKSVFRAAMRGIVPDSILDRRDKIGFATPERAWLESLAGWVNATMQDAHDIPYMRMDNARKEWQNILAGKQPFDARVWRWLCYTRWVQLFTITD